MGENRGLIKLITTVPENTVVGAHIIGPNTSELIHELVLAVNNSATAEDISRTIHAHQLSEAVMKRHKVWWDVLPLCFSN